MRQMVELLAPAGSFEALQAAVQNGCDAVYLGGTMFGARAFAHNFDEQQLREAIAYAHGYGVRVYVTVNTLIYEAEISAVLDYVRLLQEADADALIVQDLGLFTLLRKRFPDMELHASTQMHIHNTEGIRLLQELGATRVVVPREMTIEEITELAKLGVDLEVFVQGALCVSYSGQCLMSSLTLGRSGNRGECAQSCRMQYTLESLEGNHYKTLTTQGKYLLSPKDLNTLAQVPQLIAAGIASFKIEGRMKRPEYVALMTSLYRQAIDAYQLGKKFSVSTSMQEAMEKIFHRGFTQGHLFHQRGSDLMNARRPNHMGIPLGIVEEVGQKQMTIKLLCDVTQGDGVRILQEKEDEGFRLNRIYQKGLLVNGAQKGEWIQLDKKGAVKKGSQLVKTSDVRQLAELRKSFSKQQRRVPLHAVFSMQIGKPALLTISDEQAHTVTLSSAMCCELALKTPLSKERIEAQLRKCGDTLFEISEIDLTAVDEKGILPIKELNRLRREAMKDLLLQRQRRHGQRRFMDAEESDVRKLSRISCRVIIVHTKEQFEVCKAHGCDPIFVADPVLYQQLKQQGEAVYLREPRVKKTAYQEKSSLIQEAGGLWNTSSPMVDTSLNITNSYAAAFAFERGAKMLALSIEHNETSIQQLIEAFTTRYHTAGNFAIQLYGHVELMLSEYCPIQTCLYGKGQKHCGACRGKTAYVLKDLKGHRYPVLTDSDCRIHLLSEAPCNRIAEFPRYQKLGVHSSLCVFTIEDSKQVQKILKQLDEVSYDD